MKNNKVLFIVLLCILAPIASLLIYWRMRSAKCKREKEFDEQPHKNPVSCKMADDLDDDLEDDITDEDP